MLRTRVCSECSCNDEVVVSLVQCEVNVIPDRRAVQNAHGVIRDKDIVDPTALSTGVCPCVATRRERVGGAQRMLVKVKAKGFASFVFNIAIVIANGRGSVASNPAIRVK